MEPFCSHPLIFVIAIVINFFREDLLLHESYMVIAANQLT